MIGSCQPIPEIRWRYEQTGSRISSLTVYRPKPWRFSSSAKITLEPTCSHSSASGPRVDGRTLRPMRWSARTFSDGGRRKRGQRDEPFGHDRCSFVGLLIVVSVTIMAGGIVWAKRQVKFVAAERAATYRGLFALEPLPPPGTRCRSWSTIGAGCRPSRGRALAVSRMGRSRSARLALASVPRASAGRSCRLIA